MKKPLYEEVVSDIRQLRQVAEDNASRALLEAVAPRIRELIEEQLVDDDEEIVAVPQGTVAVASDGDVIVDLDTLTTEEPSLPGAPVSVSSPSPITPVSSADAFEVDALSLPALATVVQPQVVVDQVDEEDVDVGASHAAVPGTLSRDEYDIWVSRIDSCFREARTISGVSPILHETKSFCRKLSKVVSLVEDTYERVQASTMSEFAKNQLGTKLEACYEDLMKTRENVMKKRTLNEDLTVTLKGDVELGSDPDDLEIEVTSETGEEDESSVDDDDVLDLDLDAEEGEEGEEGDLDVEFSDDEAPSDEESLDLGLDDEDEEAPKLESSRKKGDVLLEIDERELAREVRRLRSRQVRESADAPSAISAFGDGEDEGEPLEDVELTTEASGIPTIYVDDETGEGTLDGAKNESEDLQLESLKRKLRLESRIYNSSAKRVAALKDKLKTSRGVQFTRVKQAIVAEQKRCAASVTRVQEIKKRLNESKSRTKSGAALSENATLRRKLAESSLNNVKLKLANKLFLVKGISESKRIHAVSSIDRARTLREAELIYRNALASRDREVVSESRGVIGASSRVARPTSTTSQETLNEGFEVARWMTVAGIK